MIGTLGERVYPGPRVKCMVFLAGTWGWKARAAGLITSTVRKRRECMECQRQPRLAPLPLLSVMRGLPHRRVGGLTPNRMMLDSVRLVISRQHCQRVGWKPVKRWDPGSPTIAGRRRKGVGCSRGRCKETGSLALVDSRGSAKREVEAVWTALPRKER